jgi:hypothetical protein
MIIETIQPIADEVIADLGIDGKQVSVQAATGEPNSGAVQIRIADASGDSKSVTVDLRDATGQMLSDDEIRQRLREQLATFKETALH